MYSSPLSRGIRTESNPSCCSEAKVSERSPEDDTLLTYMEPTQCHSDETCSGDWGASKVPHHRATRHALGGRHGGSLRQCSGRYHQQKMRTQFKDKPCQALHGLSGSFLLLSCFGSCGSCPTQRQRNKFHHRTCRRLLV